jgi:hypothetical protein
MSDFSDNHGPHKRKCKGSEGMRRVPLVNAIEGLLKWREEIANTVIPEPTKDNSQ